MKNKTEAYDQIKKSVQYLEQQPLVAQEWQLVQKISYYFRKFQATVMQTALDLEEDKKNK